MILFIKDRLAIMQLLPQNGSISEMLDIMEVLKKVRIEHEEKLNINLKLDGNNVVWDSDKDLGKDVTFTYEELSVLKSAVQQLSDSKKVTRDNLDICLKISKL